MRFLAALIFLASLGVAASHPVWPWWQCLAVIASFVISWRIANVFPFLYPLLLVAGDAYPFTGQLVVQEYDSLLLGSLAGWIFCQIRIASQTPIQEKSSVSSVRSMRPLSFVASNATEDPFRFAMASRHGVWLPWAGLALSIGISLLIGWARLPSAPWGDQLSVYFTGHNTWRIAKGYGWGILFAMLALRQSRAAAIAWQRAFGRGMQAAAVYVGLFMIFERTIFEGFVDFERQFRAAGPFFTMHIGDQHVDAFVVLALPFAWIVGDKKPAVRLSVGVLLSLLMILASLATMSRGTIAAVMLQVVLLALVFAIPSRRSSRLAMLTRGSTLIAVSAVVLLAIIGAIWKADAIRGRFESSGADWQTRVDHWKRIVQNTRGVDWLFGRGMGTLPTMMARQQGRATPPVSWMPGSSVGALRLKPGWPLYVERYTWPADPRPMTLQLTIAPDSGNAISSDQSIDHFSMPERGLAKDVNASLHFFRCYKSMLHSYEMTTAEISLRHDTLRIHDEAELRHFSATLPKPEIEPFKSAGRVWRPEAVGMSVSGESDLMLWGSSNITTAPWISASHSAPWTFTCDDHLIWRAKNAGVHLLFEHGLFGLIAFAAVLWQIFGTRATLSDSDRSRANRRCAIVAIFGFAFVAFFGSLIDTAWITALLLAVMSYAQRAATVSLENANSR